MANLTINAGINSLGNFTDTAIPLAGISNDIKSVKTLVNGQWKSWTIGTPEAFQGIVNIDSGKGFVVKATNNVDLTVADTNVNMNTVEISNGLNFLCFPYNDKPIIDGFLPRTKSLSIKTLIGTWKSWTSGAPEAFQGFNAINKNNGYICNIEKVFGNYIDNNARDVLTGVRIGTKYANDTTNTVISNIVEFTPDITFGQISYDVVSINDTLPLNDMWIKINNITKLVRFPIELEGKRFSIKELTLEAINYGTIFEVGDVVKDNGFIIDTNITTEDLGDLTGGFKYSDIVHTGIFTIDVNNTELNPIVVSDKIILNSMEVMYDVKPVSPTTNYNKMYLSINGSKTVIEFADEYLNDSFVLVKDNIIYNSNFIVSDTFTIL